METGAICLAAVRSACRCDRSPLQFCGEDVQIYRLRASPAAERLVLREYVSDANGPRGHRVESD
ncbi:hypothetical protein E0H64_36335 [Rhizobium leguminosarum bv. viciae]|nr:hypothetical protein E0H64_36335 [Rhizobium leguminosarum bv. viciae]